MMKTHYDVLGVPPNADHETVKAAYRRIVKTYHPDLHEGDRTAEVRSKQINTAYAVLKDPERRARYDEHLRLRRSRVRLFAFTVLVSAGLVSGSTLFFLDFLLKPDAATASLRIAAATIEKTDLAESAMPAAAKGPAESAAPSPAPVAVEPAPEETASLPEPAQTPSAAETAWLEIEKSGNAGDIWLFIREHGGTPQAALAEKRLEPLIDAIEDIETLKALRAKATGSLSARVLRRLGKLAASVKDDVPPAVPQPPPNVPQAEPVPATTPLPAAEAPASEPKSTAAAHDDGGPRLASSDPQSALNQALSLMSSGQYLMATPVSRDSAPIAPGNAKYYLYRAGVWAGRGDLDRALTDYDAAILLDSGNIAAFHGRGLLRWRRGETELALADFDQAIRLSFTDPKIYLDRGKLWYERGRYDRAIADFNQAIKLAPYLANAYSYRGTALRRKRDFKSAIADLDQAILLNPDITEAYRNRDLARTERDEPADAVAETSR